MSAIPMPTNGAAEQMPVPMPTEQVVQPPMPVIPDPERKVRKLEEWSRLPNLCDEVDEDELKKIGLQVTKDYEIDKTSRSDWEQQMEKALKVAKQVMEAKEFPWPGAANVKYPLITTAAIQFAARAYPEIIKGSEVVKAKVVGEDPTGEKQKAGERVSMHMSWQCMTEIEEWDEDTDKLLHILPVWGLCYRKTYFDPVLGRNESCLRTPDQIVVHYKAKSLESARRITEEFSEYQNNITEYVRSEVWKEQDFGLAQDKDFPGDDDAPHEFLEQHRWWDLDGDGYEEPYVITVHKATSQVVRIIARYDDTTIHVQAGKLVKIEPVQYYTKYSFIPSPDGSFYDLGFGILLNGLNESVNTLVNQLLDAGSLANRQGGFISRGLKFGKKQAGPLNFKLGEWKHVDVQSGPLKDNILPLPVQGPSDVLFKLLGLLVDAAKDISSVKDVLTGTAPAANTPATTTVALIEQGQKVFTAIYKRVYRSLSKEFKKLFRLNALYLNPTQYFTVLDTVSKVYQQDYSLKSLDVVPVADPSLSSDVLRLAKTEAAMQISGRPGVNEYGLTEMYVESLQLPNKDQLIVPKDQVESPMDPKVIEIQAKMELEAQKLQLAGAELELKQREFALSAEKTLAEIENLRAKAIEAIAKAQTEAQKPDLEREKMFVEMLSNEDERMHEARMSREQHVHEHVQGGLDREQAKETAKKPQPRRKGGYIQEGQPYLVGEEGPEVIIPSSSGIVIPNNYAELLNQTEVGKETFNQVYGSGASAPDMSALKSAIPVSGDYPAEPDRTIQPYAFEYRPSYLESHERYRDELENALQKAATDTNPESAADLPVSFDASAIASVKSVKDAVKNPNFQKWFGNSKVVDEAGNPLVVYHGSHRNISQFKPVKGSHLGFHFGDVEAANARLEDTAKGRINEVELNRLKQNSEAAYKDFSSYRDALHAKGQSPPIEEITRALDAGEDISPIFEKYAYKPTPDEAQKLADLEARYKNSQTPIFPFGEGSQVGQYYLSVQKPLRLPDVGNWGSVREIKKYLPWDSDARSLNQLKAEMQSRGYDGIVYANRVENPVMKTDSYIAFEPTQIKSVFNRGTFDPKDPDILRAVMPPGGSKKAEDE